MFTWGKGGNNDTALFRGEKGEKNIYQGGGGQNKPFTRGGTVTWWGEGKKKKAPSLREKKSTDREP